MADGSHGLRFYTAGVDDMLLTDNGTLHVDGDIVAYSTSVSDERFKENIEIISNALKSISKIDGVKYNFKKDGREAIGVIAQQVEKVVPSAVQTRTTSLDEDWDGKEYKTVEYSQLIALLIEAIKELKADTEELRAMIGEIKG